MPVLSNQKPCCNGEFALGLGQHADCVLLDRGPARVTATHIFLFIMAIAIIAALLVRRRSRGRRHAVSGVLDAADALEERLRTARAEIEAVVGSDADPVRDAMREMLRQRLWLKERAGTATLEELTVVKGSIDAARLRIDQQLEQIERARAVLR